MVTNDFLHISVFKLTLLIFNKRQRKASEFNVGVAVKFTPVPSQTSITSIATQNIVTVQTLTWLAAEPQNKRNCNLIIIKSDIGWWELPSSEIFVSYYQLNILHLFPHLWPKWYRISIKKLMWRMPYSLFHEPNRCLINYSKFTVIVAHFEQIVSIFWLYHETGIRYISLLIDTLSILATLNQKVV